MLPGHRCACCHSDDADCGHDDGADLADLNRQCPANTEQPRRRHVGEPVNAQVQPTYPDQRRAQHGGRIDKCPVSTGTDPLRQQNGDRGVCGGCLGGVPGREVEAVGADVRNSVAQWWPCSPGENFQEKCRAARRPPTSTPRRTAAARAAAGRMVTTATTMATASAKGLPTVVTARKKAVSAEVRRRLNRCRTARSIRGGSVKPRRRRA